MINIQYQDLYTSGLLSDDNNSNIDFLIQEIYSIYLHKFEKEIDSSMKESVFIYIENLHNFVYKLREQTEETIGMFLKYINDKNPALVDLVIMNFCLPCVTPNINLVYTDEMYRMCIASYFPKLKNIINHDVLINFGCEYLTKNCNIPVFCIDILWKFMVSKDTEIEYAFSRSFEHGYINIETHTKEIIPIEFQDDHKLQTTLHDDYYIVIKMNYNDVFSLGLGKEKYGTDTNFRDVINFLFTDPKMIEYNTLTYKSNFTYQLAKFRKGKY
jgi:hypothetical protein